jgi:hypothetical protein
MQMRKIHGVSVCVLTLSLVPGSLVAQVDRTNLDEGFDRPLKKTIAVP